MERHFVEDAAALVMYSTALGATFGAVSGRLRAGSALVQAAPAAARVIARRSVQVWSAAGFVHGMTASGLMFANRRDTAVGRGIAGGTSGLIAGLLLKTRPAGTAMLAMTLATCSALELAGQKSGP